MMMMMGDLTRITYRYAEPADMSVVRRLLSDGGLPHEDIAAELPHFVLAESEGDVVGCVGLEPLGECGLLRSLAVAPSSQGRGIGETLCARVVEHARQLGLADLYLLTTSAEKFFQKRGYTRIERSSAPPAIRSTSEFRSCCPSTAVCMAKRI